MGRKGYNWKARQVSKTIIDDSETRNIPLDLNSEGHYDNSNQLVLPSKKRKTKIKKNEVKIVKILSKKHRKRLEKIVEKKKKKDNRSTILDELEKIQLPQKERDQLTSLASVQTKGLKRIFKEAKTPKIPHKKQQNTHEIESGGDIIDLGYTEEEKPTGVEKKTDLNTVGFTSSSDSESNEDEEEEEVPNKRLKLDVEEKEINCEIEETKEKIEDVNKMKETETRKIVVKEEVSRVPAVFVEVIRDPKIQEARLKLPILAEEQQIMETIKANPIVVISGETGSGKTTQIPQFLYEAGYALEKQIAITEPRRIAAISMSERVAEEMNLSSREVSYLVRFQGNVTDDTKIKFMTDGVLLKEIQREFLLKKYSVIIIDEAHERSLDTDILIGFISRIANLRQKRKDPLKVIIMSATLRVEDFTSNKELFKVPPPVINVDTRQFPVTVHFNKRTEFDYVREAFRKTVKIHTTLPDGGVLIFVTGQQEVKHLVNKLRKKFPYNKRGAYGRTETSTEEFDEGLGQHRKKGKRKMKVVLPQINLNDYNLPSYSEQNSDDEESDFELEEEDYFDSVCHGQPMWVLPLYSMLPVEEQRRVFTEVPTGCRLCVVSTNIAQTSLTIPGIKYVVDTGKTKTKVYDKVTGVSTYQVCWTSKASADQRAGRAGRLGAGHCYRLYSSAVFNDVFKDFSDPEIRRAPLDDLYLRMQNMNIHKVIKFPFPTKPDEVQLKTAESRLKILQLLDKDGKITEIGKTVSKYPVLPRFGKMLALSHQVDILPYTICLVAALSVPEVLLKVPEDKWDSIRFRWAGTGNMFLLGDNMVLLKAVGGAEVAHSQGKLDKFCWQSFLNSKAITEIRKLRIQLSKEISANVPGANVVVDPKLPPPTDIQAKLMRQLLLAALGDKMAKKMSADEIPEGESRGKYKYAYHANNMEDLVFLHQSSVLKKKLPEFVVYQELYEIQNQQQQTKIYMRGVTAVEPDWLPVYVPTLCNLSAPLEDPPPCFKGGIVMCTVKGTFGSQGWTLPLMQIEFPQSKEAYQYFAQFLLEGEVFEQLKKYKTNLLNTPGTMTRKYANLVKRTSSILNRLLSKNVRDKESLLKAWEENPRYSLDEYLEWLPQELHGEVMSIWPPK